MEYEKRHAAAEEALKKSGAPSAYFGHDIFTESGEYVESEFCTPRIFSDEEIIELGKTARREHLQIFAVYDLYFTRSAQEPCHKHTFVKTKNEPGGKLGGRAPDSAETTL